VNEHNRVAFADRLPPPAVGGQPTYVGVKVCAKCHADAKTFWDTTKHGHAYATLSSQNKEFNLDCVSCHVTGYDQPGGSSVTHVDALKDVQCEVCHGPGSVHAAKPKIEVLHKKPTEDSCLACHHPPHVEQFDAKAKMTEILGPGHGL
jgi:RecJ-like exonuclease